MSSPLGFVLTFSFHHLALSIPNSFFYFFLIALALNEKKVARTARGHSHQTGLCVCVCVSSRNKTIHPRGDNLYACAFSQGFNLPTIDRPQLIACTTLNSVIRSRLYWLPSRHLPPKCQHLFTPTILECDCSRMCWWDDEVSMFFVRFYNTRQTENKAKKLSSA